MWNEVNVGIVVELRSFGFIPCQPTLLYRQTIPLYCLAINTYCFTYNKHIFWQNFCRTFIEIKSYDFFNNIS